MTITKKEIEDQTKSSILYFYENPIPVKDIEMLPSLLKMYESFCQLKPPLTKIFKTNRPNDFSLTLNGFFALISIKTFPCVYSDKLTSDEIITINTLITLNKNLEKPYLIFKTHVYYFDELFHAQKIFYGSLIDLIKAYKT
jgi:hypothetical protein